MEVCSQQCTCCSSCCSRRRPLAYARRGFPAGRRRVAAAGVERCTLKRDSAGVMRRSVASECCCCGSVARCKRTYCYDSWISTLYQGTCMNLQAMLCQSAPRAPGDFALVRSCAIQTATRPGLAAALALARVTAGGATVALSINAFAQCKAACPQGLRLKQSWTRRPPHCAEPQHCRMIVMRCA